MGPFAIAETCSVEFNRVIPTRPVLGRILPCHNVTQSVCCSVQCNGCCCCCCCCCSAAHYITVYPSQTCGCRASSSAIVSCTSLPAEVKYIKYTRTWQFAVTCLTAAGTHVPYRITQFYLPPGRGDIPAFTPTKAGTRLSDPGGMQG